MYNTSCHCLCSSEKKYFYIYIKRKYHFSQVRLELSINFWNKFIAQLKLNRIQQNLKLKVQSYKYMKIYHL